MDGIEVIRSAKNDNVAVVTRLEGLMAGTRIGNVVLKEFIPMGHKLALFDITKNAPITRYGVPIGFAIDNITQGAWVTELNMSLPPMEKINELPTSKAYHQPVKPLEGYTFEGYRHSNGSVGTRNMLAIVSSVQCVTGFVDHVAKEVRESLLPSFPNVDGVVALNHSYGCGVAINSPMAEIPIKTIKNIVRNPNFGGEVMVLGLGCEKLRPESIASKSSENDQSHILYMQDQKFIGFSGMMAGALDMAKGHLEILNNRRRETCSASELVVGLQCGGSDGLSGITGNPMAGFAADLIVRAGGSVMFSEVTEVRDALHLLAPRAASLQVQEALVNEMQWYDDYLAAGGADRSANPTPGNKTGGLSNVVEKAMGSVIKSGTSPIIDVVSPGERLRKKGLSFVATPASDFVCGTLQLAAGMNMHVFITGRGSPYGLSMVPVVKVSSNTRLSRRWHDIIDIDAGQIATGAKSVEEMGWELFHYILAVASGKQQVACDKLKLHNDLVLFNPGPLT